MAIGRFYSLTSEFGTSLASIKVAGSRLATMACNLLTETDAHKANSTQRARKLGQKSVLQREKDDRGK